MPPFEAPGRHDWVWLAEDWRSCLCAPLREEEVGAIGDWLKAGRPLVVARRRVGDAPNALRLGLALPGKKRIGIHLSGDAVIRRGAGPTLAQTAALAGDDWRETLTLLSSALRAIGEEARVFGSFAWQYFVADPARVYLTAVSDVDLLMRPASWSAAETLINFLQGFSARHPAPRLDGEIILPDGEAVAWRELLGHPAKVLTKGAGNVRLRRLDDIRALYEERAA